MDVGGLCGGLPGGMGAESGRDSVLRSVTVWRRDVWRWCMLYWHACEDSIESRMRGLGFVLMLGLGALGRDGGLCMGRGFVRRMELES